MAKILVKLPDDLLALVDVIAKGEHQNRSEFVRASLLRACREIKQTQIKHKLAKAETKTEACAILGDEEDYLL